MRGLRNQSGQVMAIYAISALLIAFMTFLTIGVGVRVREKIKVQAAADAAAYNLAVAQARTLNTLAWSNRAIVAEYVSMLSVLGHASYLNFWEGVLAGQVTNWGRISKEFKAECLGAVFVECLAPACGCIMTASQIQRRWDYQGYDGAPSCPSGGPGKMGTRQCTHWLWHSNESTAKPLHQQLEMMARGYVGAVDTIWTGFAVPAANSYTLSLAGPAQKMAKATGQAVDPNIKPVSKPATASDSAFQRAVQTRGPDVAFTQKIKSEDWDSYHEILAGTRTDWILQHKWSGGIHYTMMQLQVLRDMMSCGEPGLGTVTTTNTGGGMTQRHEYSNILPVNHGHDHQYLSGEAHGEGGRHAASAEDHGSTQAYAYAGGCAIAVSTRSQGAGQNYIFMSTQAGCDKMSYHKAYDGSDDGDDNSPASRKWFKGVSSNCGGEGPGISVGVSRFALPRSGSGATESVVFNQPRAYATLQKDMTADGQQAWDFNLGAIGGSVLEANAKDLNGGSLSAASGKGFQTYDFSNKRFNLVSAQSAGLSYYHNPKYWAEVPNLWNPFWRAKLDQPFNGTADLPTSDDQNLASTVFGY